jgi:hypothetical protein
VSVLGSGGATIPALLSSGAIASGAIGFSNLVSGSIGGHAIASGPIQPPCCIHCKASLSGVNYVLIRRVTNRRYKGDNEFKTVCEACADYNVETGRFEGRLRGLIEASPFEQDVNLGILADWLNDKGKIEAETYVRSLL